MASNEFIVVRVLIFLTLIFLSYHLLFSILSPLLAPEEFLDNYKFIKFVMTFIGLHTTFALGAFIVSRISFNEIQATTLMIFSALAPTLYLFMNLELINEISISKITLGLVILCFIILQFKDIRKEIVRNYIRLILYRAY